MAEVEQRPVPIEAVPIESIPIEAIPAAAAVVAAAPAPSAGEPTLEKVQIQPQSQTQDESTPEPVEPVAVKSVPEQVQQPSTPVTAPVDTKNTPVVAEAHLVDTYRKLSQTHKPAQRAAEKIAQLLTCQSDPPEKMIASKPLLQTSNPFIFPSVVELRQPRQRVPPCHCSVFYVPLYGVSLFHSNCDSSNLADANFATRQSIPASPTSLVSDP